MDGYRILDAPPKESELERWEKEGQRYEPAHSNIVTYVSPEEEYRLTVEMDDPVHGYLIRLYRLLDDEEKRIAQTVVDDRALALRTAAEMVAGAEDLEAVTDRPRLGPDHVYYEDAQEDTPGQAEPPEGWDDEDQEGWEEALAGAFQEADITRAKGYVTTKEIDGREYYYLQWREGDSVKSHYIAPVSPTN